MATAAEPPGALEIIAYSFECTRLRAKRAHLKGNFTKPVWCSFARKPVVEKFYLQSSLTETASVPSFYSS